MSLVASDGAPIPGRLVRFDPQAVDVGDVVYEPTRWGSGDNQVKYTRVRVNSVTRNAAKVASMDGRCERTVRANLLLMSVVDVPAAPPVESLVHANTRFREGSMPKVDEPRPTPARVDDSFAAWLDMGRGLVDELEREERALNEKQRELAANLDAIDGTHRRRIEQLEEELEHAREQHQKDRELAAKGKGAIESKLAVVAERKAGLRKMLGAP